jgi:adenosine deaminase
MLTPPDQGAGDPALLRWIRELPKAELHVHLDGSLRPETLLELADAAGVPLPASEPEALARAMRADDAADLPAYLARFETTLSLLQTEEALVRATRELVEDHAAEGVRLVEIRYAPVLNTRGGLAPEAVVEATLEGLHEGVRAAAAAGHGEIRAGLVLCAIRTLPAASSRATAELAVAWRERGVVALDLAGAEAGFPVHGHAQAFEIAARGLLPATVHAGEAWGPASIRDALVSGRAARIGHGTRLHEDPELERWVRDRGIPLEICLTSNVQTRVAASFADHPLRRYFDEGLVVVPCTDNRLVSGTTVTTEYARAAHHLGFTPPELARMARMGFEAAFLPRDERARLLDDVDASLARALADAP